jgi:hypothetical protein
MQYITTMLRIVLVSVSWCIGACNFGFANFPPACLPEILARARCLLLSYLLIDEHIHTIRQQQTTNQNDTIYRRPSLSSTFITAVLLVACSNDNQTKAELNTVLPQYSTISMDKVGHKEDYGVISYSELEPKKSHLNCVGVLVQGAFGVHLHS